MSQSNWIKKFLSNEIQEMAQNYAEAYSASTAKLLNDELMNRYEHLAKGNSFDYEKVRNSILHQRTVDITNKEYVKSVYKKRQDDIYSYNFMNQHHFVSPHHLIKKENIIYYPDDVVEITNKSDDEMSSTESGEFETITLPKLGDKLLFFFLSKDAREHIPGDIEEEFYTIILPKFGKRYARVWYWKQIFSSILPIVQGRLMKLVAAGWIVKAADWVSSRFSS